MIDYSEYTVMLQCNTEGFMERALIEALRKEGFSVMSARPQINVLSELEIMPQIIISYLDFDTEENEFDQALVYMRDRLDAYPGEFMVFLIGTPTEIDTAYRFIEEQNVIEAFARPFNMKETIEVIEECIEDESLTLKKKHILVVDDDPNMLNTVKTWLQDRYQIYMANSGMSALSLLVRHKIDLILLDYEMPVIDGKTVLEMIRSDAESKDVPVMFLTAKGDREHVMGVMGLKPEKYLLKSMPPSELIGSIDEFFVKQKEDEEW